LLRAVLQRDGLRKFFRLGMEGGVMMALEAWLFEVIASAKSAGA
jgi:hypothetical protein